jgi:hypothetical protein
MLSLTNTLSYIQANDASNATKEALRTAFREAMDAAMSCDDYETPPQSPKFKQTELKPCIRAPWSCRKFVAPRKNKRARAYDRSKIMKYKRLEKQSWTESESESDEYLE